jgi:circadian clock protein KaiC
LLTVMTMVQHGLVAEDVSAPLEVSYIADTVMLLRYFEAFGEVRQAISVVKKRVGRHDRRIRELKMGPREGVRVGDQLRSFSGVLTGNPVYTGAEPKLLSPDS